MTRVIGFWAAMVLAATGCQQAATAVGGQVDRKPFFDVKGYFQEQIKELASVKGLEKNVVVNGAAEHKTTGSVDLGKELAMFMQADINRPAWYDKYRIDTITQPPVEDKAPLDAKGTKSVRFTTSSEILKTKRLEIYFDRAGKPARVEVDAADQNFFSQWKQHLSYRAGDGYSMTNDQKFIFSDNHSVAVEATFVK